jgi:hypothetical protein
MKLTIKSKTLGKKLEFSRPGKSYIYVDLNGEPGTLGNQICDHGATTGSTISYSGDSDAVFARICRDWYRAYVRHIAWMRDNG